MNMNKLAKKITLMEGLKKNISIAQVKEVMKLLFQELSKKKDEEIAKLLKKYKELKKKK